MRFAAGQQVVCIESARWCEWDIGPRKGDICTVRAVAVCPTTQKLALRFAEYRLPVIAELKQEGAYRACRFRPVRRTDIGVFTALLKPGPEQKVRA